MDKAEREAFEAWWLIDHQTSAMTKYERLIWQAACKWQRERDAEICEKERVEAEATNEAEDHAYNIGCGHCADAILNQGSEE